MINEVNNNHKDLQKDINWFSIDSIRFENNLAKWKSQAIDFLKSPLENQFMRMMLAPLTRTREHVVRISKKFLRKQLFEKQRIAEPSPYLIEMRKKKSTLHEEH